MKKTSAKLSNLINNKTGRVSITDAFGVELAVLLSDKILQSYAGFPKDKFCKQVKKEVVGKTYTERVITIADNLRIHLPKPYPDALAILVNIFGVENKEETGMFTNFYWLMPVGKFIEKYGLEDFTISIRAIEEVTKRNTGEYAIRAFLRKYPQQTLKECLTWAHSKNFHLRRLASEGLRPLLPWATKLDVWTQNPKPVLEILEILKEDHIKFVKKSVANHLRDWLKVNPNEAKKVITRWFKSKNTDTQWILKHALR